MLFSNRSWPVFVGSAEPPSPRHGQLVIGHLPSRYYSVFLFIRYWFSLPPLKSVLTTTPLPPLCFYPVFFPFLDSVPRLSLSPQSFAHSGKPAGAFALVGFLRKLGFCEPFSLESLVHSDPEAVAKPFLAKASTFSYDTFSCLATFDSFSPVSWTFVVILGRILRSFVEYFVVLVYLPFPSFRVLQLLPPFCPAHKLPLPNRYPPTHPPSCLLCDHTCLVLWCLYVVSFPHPFA